MPPTQLRWLEINGPDVWLPGAAAAVPLWTATMGAPYRNKLKPPPAPSDPVIVDHFHPLRVLGQSADGPGMQRPLLLAAHVCAGFPGPDFTSDINPANEVLKIAAPGSSLVTRNQSGATRWASVRSTRLNGGPISNTEVQNYVRNVSGMGLNPGQITSNTNWVTPPNGTPLCPGGNVANQKPGCVVQVTVNYNFKFIFPFLPAGTLPMSSESQMIITQ